MIFTGKAVAVFMQDLAATDPCGVAMSKPPSLHLVCYNCLNKTCFTLVQIKNILKKKPNTIIKFIL